MYLCLLLTVAIHFCSAAVANHLIHPLFFTTDVLGPVTRVNGTLVQSLPSNEPIRQPLPAPELPVEALLELPVVPLPEAPEAVPLPPLIPVPENIPHRLISLIPTSDIFSPLTRINGSLVQSVPYSGQHTPAPQPTRAGPLARVINNYNSASLPCCKDRFGEQSCFSLRKAQPDLFERRCLNDHDFYTLDCCKSCREYIHMHNIHPENIKALQKAPPVCKDKHINETNWPADTVLRTAPTVCKDKHSLTFCRRFKAGGMGKYSCSDAEFAVRVCRHSCGYCNDNLYKTTSETPLCQQYNKKSFIQY